MFVLVHNRVVIGVKVDGDGGGCLWVHVDGDAGASYWDNGVSEKDLIEKVGFKKSTESKKNCSFQILII